MALYLFQTAPSFEGQNICSALKKGEKKICSILWPLSFLPPSSCHYFPASSIFRAAETLLRFPAALSSLKLEWGKSLGKCIRSRFETREKLFFFLFAMSPGRCTLFFLLSLPSQIVLNDFL